MMTGLVQDQNLEKHIEKQIRCMSGFLHIFDRQQILAGKRIYSTKRLPPCTGFTASPEPVKSIQSTLIREIKKLKPAEAVVDVPESPDRFKPSPKSNYETAMPPKSPLPLPMFDLKEGSVKTSWKFFLAAISGDQSVDICKDK
ncbi:hypothetical protein L2E82_38953 [Cichorium intybus]|uniref:Uncharacterized protein n=1 Tax=Cichorium intybus TaxID=13427 RepID=A0ACB9AHW0_CICIN|nr:hypothetical protein L2E82_38953 [Cichorium intybus]